MSKKNPLEVGQHICLELKTMYFRRENEERKIYKQKIVDANKSSAYAVDVNDLTKFNSDPKRYSYLKHRIVQRTHEVKSSGIGDSYVLWTSKESFENNVKYNKDLTIARKKAREIVDKMNLAGLEDFIESFE